MRQLLIEISKHYPVLRLLRHHYVIRRNAIRWLGFSHRPLEKKTVVFQAYNGRYTCSPKALYLAMLADEHYNDFTFVWVVGDTARYKTLANQPRTTLVAIRSREYYRAFAEAKYWVVNIMLPLRIVKRKGQVMVQCWHGTPLKRLRGDIVEDTQNAMNSRQDFIRKNLIDTRRYDYLISPSTFATEKFISAFGIQKLQKDGRILEIGYPRNDALFSTSKTEIKKIKQRLGIPVTKKVILYAPTWRDDQHDSRLGYTHRNMLDFSQLQKELDKNTIVLFRAHYMIANSFDFTPFKNFVYDVSAIDDINELYLVSDALITDYSSVMFDYANLRKPMLFYMYDQDHYAHNLRGFYFDISELPGAILKSQKQIAVALNSLEAYQQKYQVAYDAFSQKYTHLDDGRATQRLRAALFDPPPLYQNATTPVPSLSTSHQQGTHHG